MDQDPQQQPVQPPQEPTPQQYANPPQPQQPAQMPQTQPQPHAYQQPPVQQAEHPQQPAKKPNPPIAAQILYALGFIGLILGLFQVVLAFANSTSSSAEPIISAFGISSLDVQIAAVFNGLLIIGGFTLINFIRAGKKWALISFTTIAALTLVSIVFDFLTRTEFERLFGNNNLASDLLGFFILAPLLVVLWTKNRNYFH